MGKEIYSHRMSVVETVFCNTSTDTIKPAKLMAKRRNPDNRLANGRHKTIGTRRWGRLGIRIFYGLVML